MSESNETKKSGVGGKIVGVIILLAILGGVWQCFTGGTNEVRISGDKVNLKFTTHISLGDKGSLSAVEAQLASKIYDVVKSNKDVKSIDVSLYYDDLEDKYGNKIPVADALDSSFTIDNLDEVRKYTDGMGYAVETEVAYDLYIVNGKYKYLWKD